MKMNEDTDLIRGVLEWVDGSLGVGEGEFLFRKAKACTGKGAIVEIGSLNGRSTVMLGLGSKKGSKAKVYAIDPHDGGTDKDVFGDINSLNEFKRNIERAGLNGIVEPIVKYSGEAVKVWDKPIELLFIDGSHKFDYVKKDFLDWSKFLVEGGSIAFHDTLLHPGPRKVVDEMLLGSDSYKDFGLIGSITYARKVNSVSFYDKIKKHYFRLIKTANKDKEKLINALWFFKENIKERLGFIR